MWFGRTWKGKHETLIHLDWYGVLWFLLTPGKHSCLRWAPDVRRAARHKQRTGKLNIGLKMERLEIHRTSNLLKLA